MIFNILLIDNVNSLSKLENILIPIKNKKIFTQIDLKHIDFTIENNNIHIIIINSKLISIDELKTVNIPIFIVESLNNKIKFPDNVVYDFISLESNITQTFNKINFCYKVYAKELQHQSNIQKLLYIDNLTSLPNRTKLIQDLQNDSIGISALAIIDINSFKEINDFFGHKIGDNIIKGIASLIDMEILKYYKNVLFYKFPSDTYCLANISLVNIDFQNIVADIILEIEKKVFIENQHEIDARATAGITFSTKNNKLITADLALQAAKKNHKNYLVFYDELDNLQEYKNNMIWTKKLKNALDKDNIIVYFQPLVNNSTKKVDKYECLVRMIDEEKVISPFFFLEVSKKANQYLKITKIVIEKSFKEFENLPFEFSVNVSYEDIEDKNFLPFIKEKLKIYNVAHKIVWEILEDEGIKNYDVLLDFINEVKSLGCKVAIDDFGSGYSNFEHLLKMNIDYLKIDASLIKNVATDENSYQVVKTIIEFAKSLKLKTIAEYVENEEIFNITKKLGATYSQGYYFAPPLSKPDLYNF